MIMETTYQPAKTNHVLHLLLSLLLCGAWLPVWAIVALYNMNRTVAVQTWVQTPHTATRPVGAYEPGIVPGLPIEPR